jgi:hypothetical protein
MNINFKDKVVILTGLIIHLKIIYKLNYNIEIGASSELGREIAILFSKLGAKLVLNSRNKEGLEETVKKCEYSDIESVNEY